MSSLSDFITAQGITADAIVNASRAIEAHDIHARVKVVAREVARKAKKSYADAGAEKPVALGRGIASGTLQRALAGSPTTRVVRKKILRALNDRLVNAKKEPVTSKAVFGDVPVKLGKSKKKK